MARSYTWNAYESTLVSDFPAGATSTAVDSTLGLVAPVYLVLEPDVPAQREWIRVGAINGNLLENITRNLEGSAGDLLHLSGSKVRAIFTKQLQDDLFDDIEGNTTALTGHEIDPADPHADAGYMKLTEADARYLRLTGGSLTGILTMTGNKIQALGNPTVSTDAANKDYVDTTTASAVAPYLLLAGGTMVGDLTLNGEPTTQLMAATKQYVDDIESGASGVFLELSGANNLLGQLEWLQKGPADLLYLAIGANAVAAGKWTTARSITLGGDASGSVAIDGSANVTLTTTVINDSHTHDTRYFTETEADSRYVRTAGADTMAGPLTITNTLTVDGRHNFGPGAGSQAAWQNTITGMEVILGTTAFAPAADNAFDSGVSGLAWRNVETNQLNGSAARNVMDVVNEMRTWAIGQGAVISPIV